MRGELQAKLDLSIEAAAISQAAQEVAAGHRRAYFWQGFLRGAKWDNKLQPLRRLVGEPSSAASATTSRPPTPPSDKHTRAEAFHEAVVLLSSPPPPFQRKSSLNYGSELLSFESLCARLTAKLRTCQVASRTTTKRECHIG